MRTRPCRKLILLVPNQITRNGAVEGMAELLVDAAPLAAMTTSVQNKIGFQELDGLLGIFAPSSGVFVIQIWTQSRIGTPSPGHRPLRIPVPPFPRSRDGGDHPVGVDPPDSATTGVGHVVVARSVQRQPMREGDVGLGRRTAVPDIATCHAHSGKRVDVPLCAFAKHCSEHRSERHDRYSNRRKSSGEVGCELPRAMEPSWSIRKHLKTGCGVRWIPGEGSKESHSCNPDT